MRFYRLTGETKFLARIPEALDWLEKLTLPPGVAPPGRTHPTFVELGTNEPLYVHREGSNVFNGRYFVDKNPKGTIVHYSSFRNIDVAGLRKQYEAAQEHAAGRGDQDLAAQARRRQGAVGEVLHAVGIVGRRRPRLIAALNAQGYWLAPLGYNSHPFKADGSKAPQPGDFSQTYVGDASDTSPFPDPKLMGISVDAYVRNMGILIRALESSKP